MLCANLRQMFSVLDVYVALLLSGGALAWRVFARDPDRAAFPIFALLTGVALSTYAQCLFGLDAASSALTRYRLLPLPGWQILLTKDAAYSVVLLPLVLPLAPAPGIAFGLSALAVGHWPSLIRPAPQRRWRFTGNRLLPGVVQGVVATALGFAELQRGPEFLAVSGLLYLASLYWSGHHWERAFA
jgi:hypothetical protein